MIGSINSNKDYGARASIDTHAGIINAHGLTFQITIPTTAWISVMADPPAIDMFYQASVNTNTISGKNLSGYNMILIPKYSTVFPHHGLPESLATAVSKIQKIRNSNGTLYFASTTNNGGTLDKPEIELVFDVHVLDKVTGEASCVIITNADTIRDMERTINSHLVADNPHGLTVTRKATADTGYIASYELMCNGQKFGDTINIPKDFLLKSATRKVCSEADVPVTGYVIGDKYIDFEINVADASETTTHLYILLSDLGGTGGSVTLDPLKSNGLTFTDEVLALELATASTPGAMSKEDKTKLDMFNLSGMQTNDTLKYDGVTGKLVRDSYIADLNITVLATAWVYDEINHVWKYTYGATSVTNTMIPHVYQQFPEDSAQALLDRIEGSNIDVVRFIDGFFVMECYTNKPSRDLSFVIKVVK